MNRRISAYKYIETIVISPVCFGIDQRALVRGELLVYPNGHRGISGAVENELLQKCYRVGCAIKVIRTISGAMPVIVQSRSVHRPIIPTPALIIRIPVERIIRHQALAQRVK